MSFQLEPARNIDNARRQSTRVLLHFYFDRLWFRHWAFREVNL
jgi:hypothetical protein